MSDRTFGNVLGARNRKQLATIAEALNSTDDRELRQELRRLVEALSQKGLEWMHRNDAGLREKMEAALHPRFERTSSGYLLELVSVPPVGLSFYEAAKVHHRKSPEAGKAEVDAAQRQRLAAQRAIVLLTALTLNAECGLLSPRPCARCARYFLKNRADQNSYCSTQCAHSVTSRVCWKRDHEAKLKKARRAIAKCSGPQWKQQVSRRAGLSVKWLTRAVNKGELAIPVLS